jgi:hypothetical protein
VATLKLERLDGRQVVMMGGGTALVRDLAAILDDPYCEGCGDELSPDLAVWYVVEVGRDDLPAEPRPSDYAYCGTGCARRDGAI